MGKMAIALIILLVLVVAATLLIKGKGGDLISAVKDLMRFGK